MTPPKSICEKCLEPIEPEDEVVIAHKCYHRKCCACCVCGNIPSVLKVYNCQVYCPECFQKYILSPGWQNWFKLYRHSAKMQAQCHCEMTKKLNEFLQSRCKCPSSPVILVMNNPDFKMDFECNVTENSDCKFDNKDMPSCSKCCSCSSS